VTPTPPHPHSSLYVCFSTRLRIVSSFLLEEVAGQEGLRKEGGVLKLIWTLMIRRRRGRKERLLGQGTQKVEMKGIGVS